MSDNEKETEIAEGTSSSSTGTGPGTGQVADWEFVQLTHSTYAASPPQPEPITDKFGNFVFPPSEHENLPIESPKLAQITQQQEEVNQEEEFETPHEEEEEEDIENEERETIEEEERETEVTSEIEKFEKREKGEEREGIEWVKKRVSCFYKHVKEANTYWSVFVAATLVGLVILGHRWQREKPHTSYQLKSGTGSSK